MGKFSRSLSERSFEHFEDARKFSNKSHMVKHWMISHPSMNSLPPFRIRITRQYKDCLSRQLGEALAIFSSKDTLLNGKNDYVNNCITRVCVQEDDIERKKTLMREEMDEKKEAEDLADFKLRKTTKPPQVDGVVTGPSPIQGRVGLQPDPLAWLEDWWEWAEMSCQRAGRLLLLRERMEEERIEVLKKMADHKWCKDHLI